MGVFIVITLILLPFFPNTGDSPERLTEVRTQLDAVQERLAQAEAELAETVERLAQSDARADALERELAECSEALRSSGPLDLFRETEEDLRVCEEALKKTFVLVVVSWSASDDVDLHVVDPAGREFYYAERRFPGSAAALEEDNTRGPGNEIWLHPEAEPGDYRVYVNHYRRDSASVTVRGSVLHQEGRVALPNVVLSREGERPLVATVSVDAEGRVTVR